MTMNDAHVTTSDLERIRAGTVTAAEAARIGTHIAGCTRCAATADEALDLQASAERLDAIFTIDENEQSPPVHRFRRRVLFAAAAAAVVIAVMAGVMLVRRGDRDRAVSTPVPSPRSLAPAEPREAPPAPSAAYRPE